MSDVASTPNCKILCFEASTLLANDPSISLAPLYSVVSTILSNSWSEDAYSMLVLALSTSLIVPFADCAARERRRNKIADIALKAPSLMFIKAVPSSRFLAPC